MTYEPSIMPFGKYKGRFVEDVLADDPGYAQWLVGQRWFRTKFPSLCQTIINRGGAVLVHGVEREFAHTAERDARGGCTNPIPRTVRS